MPLFPNKYQPSSAYFAPVAALMILFALSCQSSRHLDPGQTNKGVSHNRTISDAEQPVAVPAYPDTIEYVLPDGYSLLIFLRGDEYGHIAETADGYYLLMNDAGYYEYAFKGSGDALHGTGVTARNPEDRSVEVVRFLEFIDSLLEE